MKTLTVSASRIIDAPAEVLYQIIADYQNGHAHILPKPYFTSLEVEEGGVGEGTIIRFGMRILGQTRNFRSHITEPDPGCTLLETDLNTNASTSFTVWSLGHKNHARVTIMTMLKDRGLIDGLLARIVLTDIYRRELELLARVAKHTGRTLQAGAMNNQFHTETFN